jgi:hypothetical protein
MTGNSVPRLFPLALFFLFGGCESPTCPLESSSFVPQLYLYPECDPAYDPECELVPVRKQGYWGSVRVGAR